MISLLGYASLFLGVISSCLLGRTLSLIQRFCFYVTQQRLQVNLNGAILKQSLQVNSFFQVIHLICVAGAVFVLLFVEFSRTAVFYCIANDYPKSEAIYLKNMTIWTVIIGVLDLVLCWLVYRICLTSKSSTRLMQTSRQISFTM